MFVPTANITKNIIITCGDQIGVSKTPWTRKQTMPEATPSPRIFFDKTPLQMPAKTKARKIIPFKIHVSAVISKSIL